MDDPPISFWMIRENPKSLEEIRRPMKSKPPFAHDYLFAVARVILDLIWMPKYKALLKSECNDALAHVEYSGSSSSKLLLTR